MRILLVYPDLKSHVSYPVGLGIIASVLKKKGHEVRMLHLNEEIGRSISEADVTRLIQEFEPQFVAFSTTTNQFRYVKEIAKWVKGYKDIPVLVGGIHPTIAPEEVISLHEIDFLCRGEGEEAFAELIESMASGQETSAVQNIWAKKNGKIVKNPVRPLISDLDALPFPDRRSFDYNGILRKKRGWGNVMAGRGCPFKCTYCVNHFYHALYQEHHDLKDHLRMRKVDTVLDEIEEMVEEYPIRLINFDDDTFTWNREWLKEFCERYGSRFHIPFACDVRPNTFNVKTAKMLRDAGCVEVKIGLESGSPRVREEILKRNMSDGDIIRSFEAAEAAGIRAWAFNMIGIPTETKEDVFKTIRLNARIRPYILRCAVFFPYPGTELHKWCEEKGLIAEKRLENYSTYFEGSVLDLKEMPAQEIVKMKALFKWYVDAHGDTEAKKLFKELIAVFEKLPDEVWQNGKGDVMVKKADRFIDDILRKAQIEHYASRKHLHLNYTKKLNFKLP